MEKEIREAFSMPFEAKSFYSRREYVAYEMILPIAKELGMELMSKVRLIDLVGTPNSAPREKRYVQDNRIFRMHLDFVLVDTKKNKAVLAIEVDDKSHRSPKQQYRDKKKDIALAMGGIPLLRIPEGWFNKQDIEREIKKALACSVKE